VNAELMQTEISDFKLVNDFINGDAQAFGIIVKRYQEKIYWHARRMTGNHLDADDIVQQVLIVMYNKLTTFNFQSSLYTWIFKITATRSLNLIKTRKIKSYVGLDDIKNTANPGNDIVADTEQREKLNNLQKYLEKLPAKQREIFIFRHFDDLSYEEISQITGKSVGTLKANYFHAIKKIKDMMKDE
jgi:RNA polymerase sigma-70 factor, ECF subfamily